MNFNNFCYLLFLSLHPEVDIFLVLSEISGQIIGWISMTFASDFCGRIRMNCSFVKRVRVRNPNPNPLTDVKSVLNV